MSGGPVLTKSKIRFPLNPLSHIPIACLIQARAPLIWRAQDLDVEVGIYNNTEFVGDLSAFISITMEIVPDADRTSAPLIQKIILVADMDATCDLSSWTGGTKQHAKFELSNSETNFAFAGAVQNLKKYWVAFYATLTGPIHVPLGGTTLTVEDFGANNGLPVLGSNFPMWRISSGNDFQLRNKTTGNYHSVWVDGVAPNVRLVVATEEP